MYIMYIIVWTAEELVKVSKLIVLIITTSTTIIIIIIIIISKVFELNIPMGIIYYVLCCSLYILLGPMLKSTVISFENLY